MQAYQILQNHELFQKDIIWGGDCLKLANLLSQMTRLVLSPLQPYEDTDDGKETP